MIGNQRFEYNVKAISLTALFNEFFESEKSGGLILVACTALSILLANSFIGDSYIHFWHLKLDLSIASIDLNYSIHHWINDGLMAVFFLLVGLEIERELYAGELSSIKNAALPVIAALGGMMVPAALHFMLNQGTPSQPGIGIPMATDIAFALGVLSLLGNRIPLSLKIFLTAFAIIDDLGAIIIIAIFYSAGISILHLSLAAGVFALLLLLNRLRVRPLAPYLLLGAVMWYFLLKSGVHATIAGVALAFAVPFTRDEPNPSYRLQHRLHKPVAFVILPLFAMANTALVIGRESIGGLASLNSLGIMAGLVLGKPAGIVIFSLAAVSLKLARLPGDMNRRHLLGAGMLGGIGFTMSIFIANLAFTEAAMVRESIIAILVGSLLSGCAGFLFLKTVKP